ncbi:MAG: hypothetical protein V1818_02190 [Candidatus Aenigmatarchaeota archaeon]
MRIEIKKTDGKTAVLISFDTVKEKFDSASERNRFYWQLHGRRQVVFRHSKRYVYQKEGLLEEIPHIKVADSVFIVAMEHMKRMMSFFDEWDDKVELKTFPVLLDKKEEEELKQ